MTSEVYFPEHRHLLPLTTIRRSRMLPDTVSGDVEVQRGLRISLLDVVARGISPAPYKLLDAMSFFGLRQSKDLESILRVSEGDEVEIDQVLAEKGRKKMTSPVFGRVAYFWHGQIVLQAYADQVELQAGLNGTVIDVRIGRGAVIEGYGAVLQGVWGNNRNTIGILRIEPSNGLESVYNDALDTEFRGAIIVTRRPLREYTLQMIQSQGLVGVIAPSIAPSLREAALATSAAILLIEGFGDIRMSTAAMQFFESVDGRQAALDAVTPALLDARRPEVLINVPFDPNNRPSTPNLNVVLQVGLTVRLARGESAGAMGRIINLPKTPVLMDNGLRVQCAQVELATGEKIIAPLANLEVSGA